MKLYVGTSGFAYKEWKGKFYPPDISPGKMLAYYSERFNSVEINNTFYRMPDREVLRRWFDQVPGDFVFALKAPQVITHIKRLKNVQQETDRFIDSAQELGTKLGPLLFQLPGNFWFDFSRLETFVSLLRGISVTFEFRHQSWINPETLSILGGSNFALCMSDREPGSTPGIVQTATWGYLRLRRPDYAESDVAGWRRRILRSEWDRAFIYFKHESEGEGPRLASLFSVTP